MPATARRFLLVLIVSCAPASLPAYAPLGHEIVGAIADERLAGTQTAAKIARLLDGITLEKAATKMAWTIPDRSITPGIATLTNSCGIFGARTS
jgi:hypothetical protein